MKKVIGITGKSGAGKSTACDIFHELGAAVVDCDKIAREIVEPGSEALSLIRENFGEEYLLPDGTLHRKKLGSLVFSNPDALRRLNEITHPQIEKEAKKKIDAVAEGLILLDAPVLLETQLKNLVSDIILVTSVQDNMIERLTKRDGLTPAEAQRRLDAQQPESALYPHATILLKNNGSYEELAAKIQELYETLLKEEE